MRELDRGYPTGGKEAGEDAAKKKKTFPMPEHVGGRSRGGCTDGCTDARQLPGGAVGAGGALPGAASICILTYTHTHFPRTTRGPLI
jgi:hypothetical protein